MEKRLFFAVETVSAWKQFSSSGRIIEEKHRHLTLAFLGNVECDKIFEALNTFPLPDFKVGFVGQFDQLLFLPKKHPRVVAAHIDWLEDPSLFLSFQTNLLNWLSIKEKHPFLPHITFARAPFNIRQWKKEFSPFPLMLTHIHLFESHPGSKYTSLWHVPILPPFEEIEHTADIAYLVNAQSLKTLFDHAKTALCFTFPSLLSFLTPTREYESLEEIVKHLNEIVSKADGEIGCPFKAVSYSGSIKEENNILKWEMIIDV